MIYASLLAVALCCFTAAAQEEERRTVGNLVYIAEPRVFSQVRAVCQNEHGGHLVSIHNAIDEEIVRSFARASVNATGNMGYYVGYFTSAAMKGEWTDGSQFDERLPNWGVGHPQPAEYGAFTTGDNFWWDVAPSRLYPAICDVGGEVEATTVPPETTVPVTTTAEVTETLPGQTTPAPQAETAPPTTLGEITFVDEGMSFMQAEIFCQANFNTSLVSIHNPTDEARVRDLAARFSDRFGTYWVGYADFNGDGVVTWNDGSAFDNEFATWGKGHPQRGECGVFANDGKNRFWWDVPCATRRYPFICGAVNSDSNGELSA